MLRVLALTCSATLVACAGRQPAPADYADRCLVDLTHAFDEDTLYWPTSPSKFEKETIFYGHTEDGHFYNAYTIATPEHGGTHLDAPIHFAEGA
jgi:kynurenine formamidase